MKTETLTRMANQIADFFSAYPREQAIDGTADHLRKFWDPRMRRAILDHLGAGGSGLNEIAMAAVGRLATDAGKTPAGRAHA